MADRSISIKLMANVQGLVAGMKTAQQATEDFASKGLTAVGKNEQHINQLTNSVGAMGLALTGVALLAVKKFADFDQAMSEVAATGDDARNSMVELREAAIDAGARTAFSATEAAAAIENMAKAGISAADILGGGLDGALDLAAAGGLGVGEAAEIASIALTQFGLKGKDVSHVADLLAAGAGKAMGDVTDLGMALKQGGLIAAQTGLSIEETTGALSAFASAGLLGSDAGTSLKTMLQRLTPQSEEAQKAFDALGLSAYDANGEFVGLAEFSGRLKNAMKDLTPEARNSAMSVMFGSDAVRAANILYTQGEVGIRDWIAAVDDQGYAAQVAATRMDNLKGDIEEFTGALETAFIQAGSGGDAMLRDLVQGATAVVNKFNELPSGVQQATLFLTGSAGLVALGVAGMGKLLVGVNSTKVAIQGLGMSAKTAGILVSSVGGALAIATVGLTAWAQASASADAKVQELLASLDSTSGAITKNTREITKNDLAARQGWWVFKKESAFDSAKVLGVNLDLVTDAAMGNVEAMRKVDAELHKFDGDIKGTSAAAKAAGVSLSDYVAAQMTVEQSVAGSSKSLEEAIRIAGQKAEADEGAAKDQGDVADSYEGTTVAIEEQVDAIDALIEGQSDLAGVVLTLRAAQRGFEQALDDATEALKDNGQTLDITTSKGRANQSALDDIADASWRLIESLRANGASQSEIQASMQVSRDRFVEAATAMGMSSDEAYALADSLKLIPSNVAAVVTVNTSDAERDIDAFRARASAIGITIQARVDGDPNYNPAKSPVSVRRASGGSVFGAGTSTSDSIPALLSHGEFVVKTAAVERYGRGFFDDLNAMRFATGGYVGGSPAPSAPAQSVREGPLVHVEKVVQGTPQDVGREVAWAMAGRTL
ncbi:phage tail tape measure protein [Cellulomonas cellasea]|uniref:phage tail tape measure protein n=1 Tax=Cellulomonas cellasea TaxID=43670 RepID=UPI0025A3D18C|nr:phage tail tape measure protein [Cellulomonas cellasea]MDM8084751.1 phage tail tape measure protein [Cellulomonas cellasea]